LRGTGKPRIFGAFLALQRKYPQPRPHAKQSNFAIKTMHWNAFAHIDGSR
jgi:hypothetical protein